MDRLSLAQTVVPRTIAPKQDDSALNKPCRFSLLSWYISLYCYFKYAPVSSLYNACLSYVII